MRMSLPIQIIKNWTFTMIIIKNTSIWCYFIYLLLLLFCLFFMRMSLPIQIIKNWTFTMIIIKNTSIHEISMTKFHSGLKLTWENGKDCWQNLIGPRVTRVIHALPNNNVNITRLINNLQAKKQKAVKVNWFGALFFFQASFF